MTDTTITLQPSGRSGTVTVTASADLFSVADVGRALAVRDLCDARAAATLYGTGAVWYANYANVFRLYRVLAGGTTAAYSSSGTTPDYDLNAPHETGWDVRDGSAVLKYLGEGKHAWGYGRITAVADATHATVVVEPKAPFVATGASLRWKLGAWNDDQGWPATCTFHEARLWFGGNRKQPQTLWGSSTDDFQGFAPYDPDGTVLDTHAITVSVEADQANTIRWMSSFQRGLAIGAASAEFTLEPLNSNSALSPINIRAKLQGDRGSQVSVAQQRSNGVVLFVQRGGRVVRQLEYDWSTDSMTSMDITQLSDHIAGARFVETAMQTSPSGFLWALRSDGVLACLTYDREQKVRAWTRHLISGTDAAVESVDVMPNPTGTADDIYLVVRRTVNGQVVRHIEFIAEPFRSEITDADDAVFTDASLTYSGTTAVSGVAGLDHLEGETVDVLADGSVRARQVVSGGKVAVSGPAAKTVTVGLPVTGRITTMPIEAAAAAGTAQGQAKRIARVTLRLLDSGPCIFGFGEHFDQLSLRTTDEAMDTAVPLFTGDQRVLWPKGWDRLGQMTIETSAPLPLTVLAIVSEVQTNG
ncbi:MAG: hypothetical protein P4L83_21180 [Nevskia sp.]|nr:hypothetical protein [Nevskia sp.]